MSEENKTINGCTIRVVDRKYIIENDDVILDKIPIEDTEKFNMWITLIKNVTDPLLCNEFPINMYLHFQKLGIEMISRNDVVETFTKVPYCHNLYWCIDEKEFQKMYLDFVYEDHLFPDAVALMKDILSKYESASFRWTTPHDVLINLDETRVIIIHYSTFHFNERLVQDLLKNDVLLEIRKKVNVRKSTIVEDKWTTYLGESGERIIYYPKTNTYSLSLKEHYNYYRDIHDMLFPDVDLDTHLDYTRTILFIQSCDDGTMVKYIAFSLHEREFYTGEFEMLFDIEDHSIDFDLEYIILFKKKDFEKMFKLYNDALIKYTDGRLLANKDKFAISSNYPGYYVAICSKLALWI